MRYRVFDFRGTLLSSGFEFESGITWEAHAQSRSLHSRESWLQQRLCTVRSLIQVHLHARSAGGICHLCYVLQNRHNRRERPAACRFRCR